MPTLGRTSRRSSDSAERPRAALRRRWRAPIPVGYGGGADEIEAYCAQLPEVSERHVVDPIAAADVIARCFLRRVLPSSPRVRETVIRVGRETILAALRQKPTPSDFGTLLAAIETVERVRGVSSRYLDLLGAFALRFPDVRIDEFVAGAPRDA